MIGRDETSKGHNRMKTQVARWHRSTGFSIVDLMVAVAILAIISSLSFQVINKTRIASHEQTFISNVNVVNSAVVIYKSMGGSLAGVSSAQEVLDKLKTVADSELAGRIPGLSGSTIDERLSIEATTDPVTQSFAKWNSSSERFEVFSDATDQSYKIVKFYLEEPKSKAGSGTPGPDIQVFGDQHMDLGLPGRGCLCSDATNAGFSGQCRSRLVHASGPNSGGGTS